MDPGRGAECVLGSLIGPGPPRVRTPFFIWIGPGPINVHKLCSRIETGPMRNEPGSNLHYKLLNSNFLSIRERSLLNLGPFRIGPVSIREQSLWTLIGPGPIQIKKGVLTRGGPGSISDPRTHSAPRPGSNNRGRCLIDLAEGYY